jgi:hypothetical protein
LNAGFERERDGSELWLSLFIPKPKSLLSTFAKVFLFIYIDDRSLTFKKKRERERVEEARFGGGFGGLISKFKRSGKTIEPFCWF